MTKKKPGVGFGVMMVRNGKVLLGRRHEDPKKADSVFKVSDCWTMPGGKLDYGESIIDGAKREVLEETGITANKVKIICVNEDMNEHAHFITIGLFAKDFQGTPKVMEPDEITQWKWFSPRELPENIFQPSAKILKNFKLKRFFIKEV